MDISTLAEFDVRYVDTSLEPTLLFPWHDLEGRLVDLTTLQSHLSPTLTPINSPASNDPRLPAELSAMLEAAPDSHAINGSSSSSSISSSGVHKRTTLAAATPGYPLFGWPLLFKALYEPELEQRQHEPQQDGDRDSGQEEEQANANANARSLLYLTSNALDALALHQSTRAPALALGASSLAARLSSPTPASPLPPPPALALALEPFERITCWFRPLASHAPAAAANAKQEEELETLQEKEATTLSADRQDYALLRSCMTLLGADRCDWIR